MFLGTSTAQFLDWFKKALSGPGILRVVADECERLRTPGRDRERHRVLLEGRPSSASNPLAETL